MFGLFSSKRSWLAWKVFASGSLLFATLAHGAEHRGQVLTNNFPVPGAVVTATQGEKKFVAVTDVRGNYAFPNLPDGVWKIDVEMPCFVPIEQNITVGAETTPLRWKLKMLPLTEALAKSQRIEAKSTAPIAASDQAGKTAKEEARKPSAPAEAPVNSEAQSSSDEGFLLNGSVNNAATSQFSLSQAFGNNRRSRSIYNGGFGLIFGNSALDARPYSLTGLEVPKPSYNQVTALASFGGPLRIPQFMHRPLNFSLIYEWTRNSDALSESGLVPTPAQRTTTVSSVDPVAQSLLALYPLPNVAGNSTYNYQIPVLNGDHKDALQARMNRGLWERTSVSGSFGFQSSRSGSTNLFGFHDRSSALGLDLNLKISRQLNRNLSLDGNYSFSRLRTNIDPNFANRVNISGDAGMTGNNQESANWGPPTLVFSSGISSLTDGQSAFNRNQTNSVGGTARIYLGRHNITAGGDFRRQEFNYLSQENPRGIFTFTGEAFGSDFADFLHGVPDTAEIVYGNADKYLRESVYDLYATDDWRVQPDLTFNLGVRWEYSAPITELKNRLVNMDVAPQFTSAGPVLAGNPIGPITGEHFANSLMHPDRRHVEPRIAMSWRPIAASSLVIRAGYGIYADTSVYQSLALQLAQQAPFSKSISASNALCAQSLKTGPTACDSTTADTFGISPHFRLGYAQVWRLSAQSDLPAALQLTGTYQGIKGSNGVQRFLPNTYPVGASDPCPDCPTGFLYQISDGSSSRNEASIQLRRRLRSGLTASVLYTWSKSIDDDAILGGQGPLAAGATSAPAKAMSTAQNWRDLHAERGLSTFDQRHLLNATLQYTTGMGIGGRTLLGGWLGRIYKEWTVLNIFSIGSGLPETPIYLATVNGTGFSGSLRPDRTSAPLYHAPAGRYLNPGAYAAPQAGQWGNAGRDSITGPGQLSFNSSLSRTFRPTQKLTLDFRVDATNLLNHVVFTNYNATINPAQANPLFGLPSGTNPMRSLQITTRLRY